MDIETLPHPAWIELNLDQFRKNIQAIRKRIGSSLFCLPVKGNAYGHGLIPVAKAAVDAKVDLLAVSYMQDGILLREAGINIPILVFGAVYEEQVPYYIQYDLEVSVGSKFKAEMVDRASEKVGKRCKVHLEVDTGMKRFGVRPENVSDLYECAKSKKYLEIKGVYSHFATSEIPDDPNTMKQIKTFKEIRKKIGGDYLWHIANSGGVLNYPDSHMDMVRCGFLSYGYFPDGRSDPEIKPFLTLKAKVAYFKVVFPNEGIGYGHKYKPKDMSRVVTIPLGYGDGYKRALSNQGSILIRGKRYPIAGVICMDQFMADIGKGEAYVGDEAVIIGKQGEEEISVFEIARLSGSIPYEVLTILNSRLPRKIC